MTQIPDDVSSGTTARINQPIPAAPTVPDLTREEVLGVIDWEFSRIGDREKTLGYTRWAAATALAVVLWQITDLKEISWRNLGHISYLVVAFSVALDSVRAVFSQLAPSAPPAKLKHRIRKVSEHFAPVRFSIAVGFLWSASVLICTWAAEPALPLLLRIWISILYSLLVAVLGFGSLMAAVEIKIAAPEPLPRRTSVWIRALFLQWVVTAVACWTPFISGRWEFASSEYRAAGLVVAFLFLVDLLLKTYADAGLEPLLLALRRGVGLGFLEPSDAAHQLELAIHGEPLEEHLRSQLADLQHLFDVGIRAVEEDISALDREKADLASRKLGSLPHPEELLARYAQYATRHRGMQEMFAKISTLNETRFLRELETASPSVQEELRGRVKQIHSQIDFLAEAYLARIELCRREVDRQRVFGDASPKNTGA